MAKLTEKQAENREGFFYALAIDLWPGLRKRNAAAFDRNVQLLYEFSLQHPHSTPLAPHGYGTHLPDNALKHAEHWLHQPKQHQLSQALASGHTSAAADLLHVDYQPHALPVPLKGGYLTGGHNPGFWDTVKGTVTHIPQGAEKVGSGIGHGAEAVGGGIGDIGKWFGKNAMVIVLLIVVVLIIKK